MRQIGEILEGALDEIWERSEAAARTPKAASPDGGMPHAVQEEQLPVVPRVHASAPEDDHLPKEKWFALKRPAFKQLRQADPIHLRLYCWLAAHSLATHKDEFNYYGEFLEVRPGTSFFRVDYAASQLGTTEDNLSKVLMNLYECGYLDYLFINGSSTGHPSFELDEYAEECLNSEGLAACHLADMRGGFMKIPDSLLECADQLLVLALYVFSKARYAQRSKGRVCRGQRYLIGQGQYVGTYAEVARELGVSRQEVRRTAMQGLKLRYFKEIPSKHASLWEIMLS